MGEQGNGIIAGTMMGEGRTGGSVCACVLARHGYENGRIDGGAWEKRGIERGAEEDGQRGETHVARECP